MIRYPSYSDPRSGYATPSYYNGSPVLGSSYAPSYNGGVVTSGYTPATPATVVSDGAGSYLNQVLPGDYTPSYAYPPAYGSYAAPVYSGASYPRGMTGRRR